MENPDRLKNSIFAAVLVGAVFGLVMVFTCGYGSGIPIGVAGGVTFALMYAFNASRKPGAPTGLVGENIIKTGPANHFSGMVAIGGRLHLTDEKLIFKSHQLNFENEMLTIPISEIQAVQFYNTLGLIPNGLSVTVSNFRTEKFVVNNRKAWKAEIERIRITGKSVF